jgi:hypothetical protein
MGAVVSPKVWLQRIGLSAASLALFAFCGEAVVRLAGLGPERWARPRHLERDDKRYGLDAYPELPRGAYDVDLRDGAVRARWRALGVPGVDEAARTAPYAVALEYDERLCRLGAARERDPAVPRGLVVGDSFAEGQGVRARDTFSSVLARELPGPVEVIGCGRRGLDFPAIHEFFDRQLDLDPDVVVYAMVLNDPVRSQEFDARQAYLDDWIMDQRRMLSEGVTRPPRPPGFWEPRLVAWVGESVERIRVGRETLRWYRDMYGEPNRAGWAATQAHVVQMRAEARARGAELVVVLLPLLIDLEGDYPFEGVSRDIAAAFAARGVPFHDVTPALRGHRTAALWVHPADRHPNARAHRLIARDLRPVVERLVARARGRR